MRIRALCVFIIVFAIFISSISSSVAGQMYFSDEKNWSMFCHDLNHTGLADSSSPEHASIKWVFRTHGEIKSSVTVLDGIAYFGSGDGYVYAVFVSNGSEKWRFKTKDIVESTPTPVGDKLLFGSYDGKMYCLWLENGTLAWTFTTSARIRSSPVVFDDIVYFGSYDYKIYGIDFEDGSLIWSFSTNYSVGATAFLHDGKIYIGSHDGYMYSLYASNGSLVWKLNCNSGIQSSVTYNDGRLYFGTNEGKLYCILPDGSIEWTFSANDRIVSTAAVYENRLYFGSWDCCVYCINNSGELAWKYNTDGAIYGSVTISGDKVLIGSTDCSLYSLNARNGEMVWRYQTRGMIRGTPTVVNQTILIGSHDGYLYAFDNSSVPEGSALFTYASRKVLTEIEIPKNSTIDEANLQIEFRSYTNSFMDKPTAPSLYFDKEEVPFWSFNRAGYGSAGYQYEDHLGQESIDCSFSLPGSQSTYIVLPKNAEIKHAEFRISNSHHALQNSNYTNFKFGSIPINALAYSQGKLYAGYENGSLYSFDFMINKSVENAVFSSSVNDIEIFDGKILVLLEDELKVINETNETSSSILFSYDFSNGEIGKKVAVGDLDGDLDFDFLVCTNKGLHFFENVLGNYLVRNASLYPSSYLEISYDALGLENIDCEGYCDIVLSGNGYVYAFIGLGNWSYNVRLIRQISNRINAIAFADFDNEGTPDLLLGSSNGYVYCHRNLGNGSFDLIPTVLSGQGNVTSISVADINKDGYADIAFSTGTSAAVSLNFNDTYVSRTTLPEAGGLASDVVLSDFNDDGYCDVAYSCRDGSINVCINDGLEDTEKLYNYTISVGDEVLVKLVGKGTFEHTVVGFEDILQNYLDRMSGYEDIYRNLVRGVEIKVTSAFAGTLRIDEINIIYDFRAKVNFTEKLRDYISSKDMPSKIAIECSSTSAGIINAVLLDLKIYQPPIIEIVSPKNGIYSDVERIYFACSISDERKLEYNWSSNISGIISNEKNFSSSLPAGSHEITLEVSDGRETVSAHVFLVVIQKKLPIIVLNYDKVSTLGAKVRFDASKSYSPYDCMLSFNWSFGDGARSQDAKCSHVYQDEGNYRVNLKVSD
ncbi:MAG: PQQ-binding-like beta-propeller repeat protein, partial [Thermoplasmata archaeon]